MTRLERFLELVDADRLWSGIGMTSKLMILSRIRRNPQETCERIDRLTELWRRTEEI